MKDIFITENTLFPGLAEEAPSKAACFPYAQHYIADSPGCRTYIKNPKDMVEAYKRISLMPEIKTFSTKGIKILFFIGLGIFPVISLILLFLLLSK